MKKIILIMLGAALATAIRAQDGTGDRPNKKAPDRGTKTTQMRKDATPTTRGTVDQEDRSVRGPLRDDMRSGRSKRSSNKGSSDKALKLTRPGPTFSLTRLFDPEGRHHWDRLNRRSARQFPGYPPGTVHPK
ncbi:MAG: hypothetical protein H6594_02525 [Flavobacteriales bacterium]|nr:hypothetical protein [Flavobacteriales bacterium]